MVLEELVPVAPQVIFVTGALLLLVYDSINPEASSLGVLAGLTTGVCLAAMAVAAWFLGQGVGLSEPLLVFEGQLVVDGMSLFFTFIIGAVTALVGIASYDYLRGFDYQAEYFGLVLMAAAGMSLMASANSLVMVFISLELASLPSYALVAYLKQNRGSVEAGLKYFLIGALSSAVFVYGISLVYGATGAMRLDVIAAAVTDGGVQMPGLLGFGVLFLVGGFAFKTASVPFHFWAPDAYEGATAPISAFLSSASKAAGFVIAIRVLVEAFPIGVVAAMGIDWVLAVQVLAVVTMTVGNFAAAVQDNVKRMLAYSSIAHAGFALIGLASVTGGGGQDTVVLGATMMHLLVYGFMNTGAFLFVALAEYWEIGRTFEDYRGLAQQAPVACLAVTVFVFSLAGLPVGGGFVSKLFLFIGAIGAGFWWLAAIGVLNTAVSLYYYARLVRVLWVDDPVRPHDVSGTPTALYVALVVCAVLTVLLLPFFPVVAETAQQAASILLV